MSKEREKDPIPGLPEIRESSDSDPPAPQQQQQDSKEPNPDPTKQNLQSKRSGLLGSPLSQTASNTSTSFTKGNRPPPLTFNTLPTPAASRVQSYDTLTSTHINPSTNIDPLLTPPLSDIDTDLLLGGVSPIARLPSHTEEFPFYFLAEKEFLDERRREEEEIFGKIERVRVRYDVEVVTKLVVYAGIAFLAVQGCPVGFEWVGLGMPEGVR
jgi:hypothetical protein